MICLNSRGFGLSSSISTILGLLCGFYVLDADKLLVISTMFSLLLSDPISDSYGIYISIKENNKNLAYTKFKEIFHYKFLTQLFFFYDIRYISIKNRLYNFIYTWLCSYNI